MPLPWKLRKQCCPAGSGQDFYKVTLTGWDTGDGQMLQTRFSHLPHLTIRDERENPERLWEDAGEDTLRGMYFSLLRQQAQTDPGAVLTAEISRKLLEGREVILP